MKNKKQGYYSKGRKNTNKVFRKNFLMYLKYGMFLIGTLAAKLTIVLYPFAKVAEYNLTNEIKDSTNFQLENVLDNTNNAKTYVNVLITYLTKLVILATGFYALYLLGTYLGNLGGLIDTKLEVDFNLFVTIFIVPIYVVGIVFYITTTLLFESVLLASIKEELTASDAIAKTKEVMNFRLFRRMLFVYLANLIEVIIYLTIIYFVSMFISNNYSDITYEISMLVIALVFLMLFSKKVMAFNTSKQLLLIDTFNNKDFTKYSTTTIISQEQQNELRLIEIFEKDSEVL